MDCHHLDPGGGMDPGGERWRHVTTTALRMHCISGRPGNHPAVLHTCWWVSDVPKGIKLALAQCHKMIQNGHLRQKIWCTLQHQLCINSGLILLQTSIHFDPLNLLQLPRVGASAKLSVLPLARLSGLKPSKLEKQKQQDWGRYIFVQAVAALPCQCVSWWIKESNWTAAASVQPAVLHSHTHTDWSLSCKSCFATTSNLHLFQTDGSTIHLWN